MLLIGEVAKKSGIGIEAVRFYERSGLIPTPKRSPSGYRRYSESVIKQIQFILRAKQLGFSLNEIGELITLKNAPDSTCQNIRKTAQAKVADIQHKIDALEKIKALLTPLIDQCQSASSIDDCPILKIPDEKPNNESIPIKGEMT